MHGETIKVKNNTLLFNSTYIDNFFLIVYDLLSSCKRLWMCCLPEAG